MLDSNDRAAPDREPVENPLYPSVYLGGTPHPVEARLFSEVDRLVRVLARGNRALRRHDAASAAAHLLSVRAGLDKVLPLIGDIS